MLDSRRTRGLALRQDNTGKLAVTAQAVQARGLWDEPVQRIFAADISGHGQYYNSRMFGGLVTMQQQQQQRPSFLPQLQFNFTTSGTFNGVIPAPVNDYIPQIQHLPIVKPENYGDRASYHQNQHEGFVEQQYHQSPVIKAEQQQWRNSPPCTPVPIKTITSIPAGSGAEIDFSTAVDILMKAIQAKSSTTQSRPKSSPVQQTRPVVGTPSPNTRPALKYNKPIPLKREPEIYS